jgi:hypothetical protein
MANNTGEAAFELLFDFAESASSTLSFLSVCAQAHENVQDVICTLRQLGSGCCLTGAPAEWLYNLLVKGDKSAVFSVAKAFENGLQIKSPTAAFQPTWNLEFNRKLKLAPKGNSVVLQPEEHGKCKQVVLFYSDEKTTSMEVKLGDTACRNDTLVFTCQLVEIGRIRLWAN